MTRTGHARQRFQSDGMQSISPQRLVVLLYQRAARDVADARAAIVEGRTEDRHRNLLHAQEIIEELGYAVDPEVWEGGETILAVYDYILERLVRANVDADIRAVDEAAQLIGELAEAWSEAYLELHQEGMSA